MFALRRVVGTATSTTTTTRAFFSSISANAKVDTTPVDLHYREYPSNRTSSHQHLPLFVLHGLLGHSNNWRSVIPRGELTTNRTVYCLDLRDHGLSPHTNTFSYEALSNDITKLMDKLGLDKIDILGHSLGGKVGMATALLHPTRVNKLIVADIYPVSYEADNEEIRTVEHVIETVHNVDLSNQATRQNIDQQMAQQISSLSLRQYLLINLVPIDPSEPNPTNASYRWRPNVPLLLENYGKIRGFDIGDHWERYYNPVFFIRGGESDFINPDIFDAAVEPYFDQYKLTTIEGSGHLVHTTKPDEFVALTVDFLNA